VPQGSDATDDTTRDATDGTTRDATDDTTYDTMTDITHGAVGGVILRCEPKRPAGRAGGEVGRAVQIRRPDSGGAPPVTGATL
jgi:hypothetical protein